MLLWRWSSLDDIYTRGSFGLHVVALRLSRRKIYAFASAVVSLQDQSPNVHAVVNGHESRVVIILCSFAKGGAAERESVGFEESWEEARTDVGAGLEEWRVEWLSSSGAKGNC